MLRKRPLRTNATKPIPELQKTIALAHSFAMPLCNMLIGWHRRDPNGRDGRRGATERAGSVLFWIALFFGCRPIWPSGLTCNINGIPPQERARCGRLVEALRHAIKERRELPDGYAFQMDTGRIGTGQLVEWVELERRCCPFFGFEVRWDQQNGAVWLHLTGPEGVKDFILDEFGLR